MKNDSLYDNFTPLFEPEETAIERKSLLGGTKRAAMDTTAGIGMGLGEAAAESVDFFTDLGVYGAIGAGRAASFITGTEHDYESDERVLKSKQDFFNKHITGLLKEDDPEDEPYYNFVKNTTESVAKYATAWKSLGKMGITNVQKAMAAGAFEGLSDDPNSQENIRAAETATRSVIERFAPDNLEDFDALMNPDTDNLVSRQAIRRIMNGIDMSVMSGGLEKASPFVASGFKAASKTKVVQASRDAFEQTLRTARTTIEAIGKKTPTGKSAVFTIADNAADASIGVRPDFVFDGKMPIQKIITSNISVKFDSTLRLDTPEKYNALLADYETKLQALVPEIRDSVVSMAKTKGVEQENLLRDYAKELGVSEVDVLTERGLRDVLRAQAHNILLEQEGVKFSLAYKNFTSGSIDETDFLSATKSMMLAQEQRASLLTGAGRTLRTSQNSALAMNLSAAMKEAGTSIGDVLKKFRNPETLDTAKLKAYGESMARAQGLKQILDLSEDEFTEAIVRSAIGTDDLVKAGKKTSMIMMATKDFGDTIGRTTQAALLTGPVTIVQNTLGTAAMQGMTITEAYIKAGLKGPGTGELKKANALFLGTLQGYKHALVAMGRATKSVQSREGVGTLPFTTRARMEAGDIPAFNKAQAAQYLKTTKQELQNTETGNVMYDGLQKHFVGRFVSSKWALDTINVQDTVGKTATAYGEMRQKMVSALYIDDVFDLKNYPEDLAKGKAMLSKMMMNGSDEASVSDLRALFGDNRAISIVSRMEEWREQATQEAFDTATDVVFQRPLSGGLESVRKGMQETIIGGKVFVPFFTTPVNIMGEALQRMPIIPVGDGGLGLPIHPQIYKDFFNPAKRDEAVSKVMMGNMLAYAGMQLTEAGFYQPVPTGVDGKAFLQQTMGQMPGSVLVDGRSHSTNFLGPIHNMLAAGAGTHNQDDIYKRLDHLDDTEAQKYYDAFLYNMMNLSALVTEQPYVSGLDQITELLEVLDVDINDERQKRTFGDTMARFFGQKAGTLMPSSSLARNVSNNFMEYQMRANGFVEHMIAQFAPWLLENHAFDGYGNKIEPNRGWVFRSRTIVATDLDHKLLDEISFVPRRPKFNFAYTMPSNSVQYNPSVVINLAEQGVWNEWNSIKADGLMQRIRDFTDTTEYADNIRFGRIDLNQKAIQSIINVKEKEAFETIRMKYPAIDSLIAQETNKSIVERQKGIGQITKAPHFTGGQ